MGQCFFYVFFIEHRDGIAMVLGVFFLFAVTVAISYVLSLTGVKINCYAVVIFLHIHNVVFY